ncbi:carbon storage regulator CsrA [Brevibacillus nitrificans]|uniref:carbon storage regulator CsrA n=1 Tax=Brevibacillus nitrificans TaxID=651560 RepID=UPI002E22DFDA|nr:carbon storage regulator CsrA [Brevibacillus nitrificans]
MLVLSRKVGQSIVIRDDIVLKVVSVDGDTVKIGIEAPKNISIYREEIYDAIKNENKGAVLQEQVLDLRELTALLEKKNDSQGNQDA